MSDLYKLLEQGGLVMVPLLLVSVVAVAICFERIVYYASLQGATDAFRQRLLDELRAGRTAEAAAWLAPLKGPAAAVARAAVDCWQADRDAVEASMAAGARREAAALRRNLAILDTAYSGAPLIGLLGTITGMMGTFRTVALHLAKEPSADTTGVTAGIGEALVATATGILIAVACLVAYSVFTTIMESHLDGADALGADLLALHATASRSTQQPAAAGRAS